MQTITVSSLSALYSALASAKGGETIALKGGNYGDMFLGVKSGFDITFPSNVSITSANPDDPAVFSGLDIRDAANLTFDSVVFDYTFATGDQIYSRPFSVSGGENIAIRNSTFDGDVAEGVSATSDGYGYAIGLSVRGTEGVQVDGNEFYNFHRGSVIAESNDVTVTNNDLHSLRMDGMNFSEVTDVVIEGNYIHDFRGSPNSNDHSDMIQFWTNGTDAPSTDIVIRGNVLDVGNGTPTQSIFMRNDQVDRGLAGSEMFYKNVTIEENVIVNGHEHGITVGETAGLVVRQNSVLHADGRNADGLDASVEIPRIAVAGTSTGVQITGNITSAISGVAGQPGWIVKQNAFVQDQNPFEPGYYGDVFISSSLDSGDGSHDFLALPGGMIDRLGAGATLTRETTAGASVVTALFQVTDVDGGNIQTRTFDGRLSSLNSEKLPDGTIYEWSFGDGMTARGKVVTHTYADGGKYDVTLTVRLPNGSKDSETGQVAVNDSHILSLGSNGIFEAEEYGTNVLLPQNSSTLASQSSTASEGIQLGKIGVTASVAREHVRDILDAEDFNISFQIKADVAGTKGEIFRLHGSIITEVNTKGELFVRAFTTEGGEIRLTTVGTRVNDLKSHDIDITLDDGRFAVSIDGKVSAEAAFLGTLKSDGTHSLVFGNPWKAANFNGDLTAFDITVGEAAPLAATTISSLAYDSSINSDDYVSASSFLQPALPTIWFGFGSDV